VKENVIEKLSIQFALDIIQLHKLMVKQNEYILSKQLLRSATSIGANVQEAQAAQTKPDFAHKMSIASKEARESKNWLMLIQKSQIIEIDVSELSKQAESIANVLTKIVKTSQESLRK
jgi:four helix bundle protein